MNTTRSRSWLRALAATSILGAVSWPLVLGVTTYTVTCMVATIVLAVILMALTFVPAKSAVK